MSVHPSSQFAGLPCTMLRLCHKTITRRRKHFTQQFVLGLLGNQIQIPLLHLGPKVTTFHLHSLATLGRGTGGRRMCREKVNGGDNTGVEIGHGKCWSTHTHSLTSISPTNCWIKYFITPSTPIILHWEKSKWPGGRTSGTGRNCGFCLNNCNELGNTRSIPCNILPTRTRCSVASAAPRTLCWGSTPQKPRPPFTALFWS